METKFQFRGQVFETNSSSSHAANLGVGNVFDMMFDEEQVRKGFVFINTRLYYGEEEMRYYRPENILGYMVCDCIRGLLETPEGFDEAHKNDAEVDVMPLAMAANETIRLVCENIKENYGVELKLMLPRRDYGFFLDVDDETSVNFDYSDWEKLKRLLFHSESYIETKSRNVDFDEEYSQREDDDDCRLIETDLGMYESAWKPGDRRTPISGMGFGR